jgi:Alpha amylase, catalytic domain
MSDSRYPALYQINTRVWLTELSRALGKRATLDDIPDAELDRLVELGFDWVWFLSVWQTGPAAQAISRASPEWRHEFAETLPDLKDEDIAGSGFAIQSYTVHRDLGGAAALARLRQRLQQRGLKLMLDFVPNHMAPDHPWIDEHADCFVHGSESDLARAPRNYCRVQTKNGPLLIAYGRDPYFDGWPDTLQLNYGNPQLLQAMIGELERIAGQCDGVRCDMAMLVQQTRRRVSEDRPDPRSALCHPDDQRQARSAQPMGDGVDSASPPQRRGNRTGQQDCTYCVGHVEERYGLSTRSDHDRRVNPIKQPTVRIVVAALQLTIAEQTEQWQTGRTGAGKTPSMTRGEKHEQPIGSWRANSPSWPCIDCSMLRHEAGYT